MPTNLNTLLDMAARNTAPRPDITDTRDNHRRNASESSAAFDRTVDNIRKQDAYEQDRLDERRREDASKSQNTEQHSAEKPASDTQTSSATGATEAVQSDPSDIDPITTSANTPSHTPPPASNGQDYAAAHTNQSVIQQTNTPLNETANAPAPDNITSAKTADTTDTTEPAGTDQSAQTPPASAKHQPNILPDQAASSSPNDSANNATPKANDGNAPSSETTGLTETTQPAGKATQDVTDPTVSPLMEKSGGAEENNANAHNANAQSTSRPDGPKTDNETTPLATSSITAASLDKSAATSQTTGVADQSASQSTVSATTPETKERPVNAAKADVTSAQPTLSSARQTAAQAAPQHDTAPAQTADDAVQASTAQTVSGQHEDTRKAEIKSGAPAHTLSAQSTQDKPAPGANAANAGTSNSATNGGDTNTGNQSLGNQAQTGSQQPQTLSADGQTAPQSTDTPSRMAELIATRSAPEQASKPVDISAQPTVDDTIDAAPPAKIDAATAAKSAPAHGLRLSNAQAHQVQSQVAVHIASQVKNGASKFEIRLDPAELGRIEVQLDIAKDGKVKAMLSADQQDTLDLLQRDQKFLQKALSDAGLNLDNDGLTFSLNDQAQSGNQQADENNAGQAATSNTVSVDATDTDIPDLTELQVTESYGIRLAHRLGVNIAV